MRVVIASRLSDALFEQVRDAAGPDAEIVCATTEADLLPLMAEADIFLGGNIGSLTPALLAAAPRLHWVHSTGAGVEDMLFPAFIASDVLLTNARGAHQVAMPEYVLMAMLAWAHHLPALFRAQTRREWIKPIPDEVAGKTLGLLGYGEIGRAVAERARSLGIRCLAYRRTPDRPEGRAFVERVHGPNELHAFLGACDVVVNSLPLTHDTRGLLDARALAAMRPDAILIHLGRGPTVDQDALLAALRERRIAGAFLDVFDQEPLPPESPFWELENAIITSHTSGYSVHYFERSIAIFCENLRRFRAGQPLRNVVDKHLGY
ncbi:MAG TPA: D-2-hydroxyacid dehydrogenase [Chloroflexota bacterium]|nr:D-2-hydroxyacid dehydrogenase [Chloroflexota bacterium]